MLTMVRAQQTSAADMPEALSQKLACAVAHRLPSASRASLKLWLHSVCSRQQPQSRQHQVSMQAFAAFAAVLTARLADQPSMELMPGMPTCGQMQPVNSSACCVPCPCHAAKLVWPRA